MTYLFLGIPNFSGSTLLHNLIQTCPNVTTLRLKNQVDDFVEGIMLWPSNAAKCINGPHSIEANMEHVYADPDNYNWPLIKKCWDENWEATNPNATIRMQKSVCDIYRIPTILPHFDNLKWILSVRNPYAHVESIMRKATFEMEPLRQLDQICFHVLRSLEVQLENVRLLGDSAYVMTYEGFCANLEHHREMMGRFLPGLELMNFDSELTVKGQKSSGIYNNNEERIQQMLTTHPDLLDKINHWFKPMEHLLNAWGYELRYA